jgi:hypothetical protein
MGRGQCSYSRLTDTGARIGQLGFSEHSDSQQQESGGCWGTESPNVAG